MTFIPRIFYSAWLFALATPALLVLPAQGQGVVAPAGPSDGLRKITLAETSRGSGAEPISFAPSMPSFRWAEDGARIERTVRGEGTVWIDVASGAIDEMKKGEVPPRENPEEALASSKVVAEIESMLAAEDGQGLTPKEIEAIAAALGSRPEQVSKDGSARMVYFQKELWFHRSGEGARVLARGDGGEIRYDSLSADGKWLTYVRGNDLYLVNTATGEVRAITENGGPDQFNGVLDWVYQEEIWGRGNFQGHYWSPSSVHSVYLALDESPVHEFTVVDHIEKGHFRVEPEVTNYPKVGDPNPIPRVGIADVETAKTVWVDLSAYDGQEILIVRLGWTPDGKTCLVTVQDRIQTWADLLAVDPATGKGKVLIRETSKSWTERPNEPVWLGDGTFVWHSHRTGPMHLYRYHMDGRLIGAVTRGPWNVTGVTHVEKPEDGNAGRVWFQCTEGGDINVNLYRAELDGSGWTRLTQGEGSHRVKWNPSRTQFIDTYSSLSSPGAARVCDSDGKELLELDGATVPAAEEVALGQWELHKVKTRDGLELDAALLKPADFDPTKSYAVWISTYSGPAAPSVRNRWNRSSFFQFLAQEGVLVLQANVRTSTNRGPEATSPLYRRVGLQEVDDMVDVLGWLTSNPWADGDRVGITGYSFGGSMTANCLLRTDKFKLGIAGGGVYDWRMYDSIYTERYMRTPTDNLEGFEATSCLAQAANLKGFLHMHHGIMDDNVHVQNMYQMAHALMSAGKMSWSMMAYPQTRHGIRDAALSWHSRQTDWDLIQEHLLGQP